VFKNALQFPRVSKIADKFVWYRWTMDIYLVAVPDVIKIMEELSFELRASVGCRRGASGFLK